MDKTDFLAIKDIRDGMKNINVMFVVLDRVGTTKTKENREIYSFKVADSSAAINCSIWDEPGKALIAGDIVRLMKCYVSIFRGCLTLYSGKSGELTRMGDFCMIFNETINMSEAAPRSANPIPVLPVTNTTNGNGRPQIVNSVAPTPTTNHTAAPAENAKPKVNNNSSRHIRKPINRK